METLNRYRSNSVDKSKQTSIGFAIQTLARQTLEFSSDISKTRQIDTENSKNRRKQTRQETLVTDTEETDINEKETRFIDSDRHQLVPYRKSDRKERPY